MLEPNFSESQLQEAVNTAFIRFIFEERGVWTFANVPSLFDEFELGWDSAFYFNWISHPLLEEHEGCNFFIQYKLSYELTTRGAGQWDNWNEAYLRFKIPHCTKGNDGKYVDDYHQWERLKALANNNYPVFYATNSTLSKDTLKKVSKNGNLLPETPFLDVRGVALLHKYVTFTSSSDFFLLHSEIEKSAKVPFDQVLGRLKETRNISLSESNSMLYKSLKEIKVDEEAWQEDLSQIAGSISEQDQIEKIWLVRSLLIRFFRKHVGVQLYWYPMNG